MVAVSEQQPFPGLRPFGFADHAFFFGRDQQIHELRRKLTRNRFIAVVGSSGCGKSSLVKAGLLPLLSRESKDAPAQEAPPHPIWLFLEIRPQGQPLHELASAIVQQKRRLLPTPQHIPQDMQISRSEALLRRSSAGLIELIGELRLQHAGPVLLVVDQFEELFRFARTPAADADASEADEAAAFVSLLLRASENQQPAIHVLLTMRSDFLGDCTRFRGLPEAINDSQFLVPRLTRDQRRQVIEQPVKTAGSTLEPALLQRLLNDVGDDPDQLPVLQHALMRTWQHASRRWQQPSGTEDNNIMPPRQLILADYEAIGGMAGALSRHADDVFEALPDRRAQLIAEQIFKALTDLDREGRAIRRTPPPRLRELIELSSATAQEVSAVIDAFRAPQCCFLMPPAAQLLNDDSAVDISHEALIRRWRKLSGGRTEPGWLYEEAQNAKIYTALLDAADIYHADNAAVLAPAIARQRLNWWNPTQRNAVWAERYGGRFEQIQQLLAASRQNLTRERHKRFLINGLIAGIVITSVATGLFYYSQRQAVEQRRQAQEQAQLEAGLRAQAEEALAMAEQERRKAEAARQEAIDTLLQLQEETAARQQAEQAYAFAEAQAEIATTQASLERSRLLARQSLEQTARGDAATGLALALQVLDASDNNERPYVPEAEQAAYAALRELRERQVLLRTEALQNALFADNDQNIVTTGVDGIERRWRADSGELISETRQDIIAIDSPLISPDGRYIATTLGSEAQLWDAASGQRVAILGEGNEQVSLIQFSPDSRLLASAGGGKVRLWDINGAQLLGVLSAPKGNVNALGFSPDGRYIAGAAGDAIYLWAVPAGQQLATLAGHTDEVTSIQFSANGRSLLSASLDGTVRLWSVEPVLPPLILDNPRRFVLNPAQSATGKAALNVDVAATAPALLDLAQMAGVAARFDQNQGISIWQMADNSGKPRFYFDEGITRDMLALCVTAETVWTVDSAGLLQAYDYTGETARPDAPAPVLLSPVAAAFKPDCRLVSVAGRNGEIVTDVSPASPAGTVSALASAELPPDLKLSVSSNGRYIIGAAHDQTLRYVIGAGTTVNMKNHDRPSGDNVLAVDADSALVASGQITRGGTRIVIWRAGDGNVLTELLIPATEGWVTAAAFAGRGRRVLAVAENGPIRLWDLQASTRALSADAPAVAPISVFGNPGERFLSITVGGESEHIAAARADGSVIVWPVFPTTQAAVDFAGKVLPRELSDTQRCQFGLLPEKACQESAPALKAF